ncbi:1,4-alpha-glucan branching enzyme [Acididesulfobacillus acetoxydans]|uniref:1,4-alpha-glucan branching enzyme GlgB n=1 Tax=Acididesulfobacillus acetoxydans TaxID=1561005 RepID=A0A8S0Y483_9FIRM|nr:1,4-alpha-glucan branching protein GlgB [Acididesulfobacillus acetoxydans]CAA7602785.1 1,4-alpha-glucan branching enzyme [Acididesulfobacillus acetoxydans]CEJ06358.1 1,4-alpha-glucan branching enzyme GlgB [Acididesulfobacillus acetoxydans]
MDSPPFLSPEEIYLFNRGELYKSYTQFGAHRIEQDGYEGTHFALWVPEVAGVSVVGDFNAWDAVRNPLSQTGETGVWTTLVPGDLQGQRYKYAIRSRSGEVFLKSDPYAFYSERRPLTASLVYSLEGYPWRDGKWLKDREKGRQQDKPLSIYEVHLGSWRRKKDGDFYSWEEFAGELLPYVLDLGYTHIELMPIMEHPYDGSWGYQVTGYYSVTSRYGDPKGFMSFVDRCHQAGIGVILDWVPGHFCKDAHGLGRLNGAAVYEKEEHGQWGTYNFNFAQTEVWSFLISNALFWLENYHVDGLRVDGVSSMLYLDYGKEGQVWKRNIHGGRENLEAVAFMRKLNQVVFRDHPGVLMIAEEATDWPLVSAPTYAGGLGFNFKWNMGWMNDILRYMQLDFDQRQNQHTLLTFSLTYAFSENFILALSHDEVVHGKKSLIDKMPGDYGRKFAGLRNLQTYLITHPGKKLMFMGGEFAQFIEWRYAGELDWFLLAYDMHRKYREFVKSVNELYRREKALWENDSDWAGFQWTDADNRGQSILVFRRSARDPANFLVVVSNFRPVSYPDFRIGVPERKVYSEIFNSDREAFGGLNITNPAPLVAERVPWQGQAYSLRIKLPPLATVILKPQSAYKLRREV